MVCASNLFSIFVDLDPLGSCGKFVHKTKQCARTQRNKSEGRTEQRRVQLSGIEAKTGEKRQRYR